MSEDKQPLNDPYEFYDEYEIEDINTGENYHYDDRPAQFGLIGGGLALLACLIVVALMGVIYHRDGRSLSLCHLIMACIGVLAAALCAAVCVMTKGAMQKRGSVNHMLLAIGLIAALIFFCYFLASSVYVFMYRPFHYAKMIDKYNNSNEWNDTFGNDWTFEDGWGEDRRIIWWAVFFGLVACIGFLIAAVCLWRLSQFPVQAARLALGAACLAGVILGCFAIDYLWTARKQLSNFATRDINQRLLLTLMILLVVGVTLLVINAVLNLLKKRVGHFVMGILLVIFLFIFICVLGLILRDLRMRQFKGIHDNSKCASILDSLHQDSIKDACPSKYINTSCTKEFLVNRWETDGKPAFLNPGCCQVVNSYLLWNLYIVGCLSLLFATAILVAVAFNLYLSDPSEYLEFADKKFGLFELVFLVLCLLTIIAFAFYWGFRPADQEMKLNANNPDVVKSGYLGHVEGYSQEGFTVVDMNKVYNGKIPASTFGNGELHTSASAQANKGGINNGIDTSTVNESNWFRTKNQILTLTEDQGKCTGMKKCGFRIGILAINGKFQNYSSTNKNLGSEQARTHFFNDGNANNDFLLLFGSSGELNRILGGLAVVPNDISRDVEVVFNGEQLDLEDLDSLGLKNGEATNKITLSSTGPSFKTDSSYTVVGFNSDRSCYQNNACNSNLVCTEGGNTKCKKAFVFYPNDGMIDVQIPLKVLNVDNEQVPYPENTIRSTSYYTYNGRKVFLKNVGLHNSNVTMKVPNPVKAPITLDLNLFDSANRYLPASRNYEIPVSSSNPYVADNILLLTKNGKGCIGSTNLLKCYNDAKLGYTNIEVLVKDGETGEAVSNLPVRLYSGQTLEKYLSQDTSNEHGNASFENVAYDNYTVVFEGNDTYAPSKEATIVQSENDGSIILLLRRKDSSTVVLEQYISNGSNDRDFALSIVSKSGAECKVDPMNKYCAYASYETDVSKNKAGYERINIEKFTVSHYLSYLRDAPAYSGSCAANKNSAMPYYPNSRTTMRSLSFDWKNVRKMSSSNINYQTLYCFTGWGMNSRKPYRASSVNNEPKASQCAKLYPSNSSYNLDKLEEANNK